MILLVVLSCIFFLSIGLVAAQGLLRSGKTMAVTPAFLPKSRTEMIKGMAAIAIVFSHIATYSKGAAPSGLLRYYNLFCASLGGIGVNLFFFVSGYGNYFSVLHNKEERFKWLWKRCAVLLIAYAICHLAVLGVLYCGGYRSSLQSEVFEFLHLTIPYSSVWYVKIQLLAYVFLVLASFLKTRKQQAAAVMALCLLSSILLFGLGLDEKWWKSTLCFAVGVYTGAYKSEVESYISRHKKVLMLGCVLLLPIAYVGAVLIGAYPVKTAGNIVLCVVILGLVELLQMDNKFYFKLGSYSLPLYLVHRSFAAWLLNDGVTTVYRVALIVVLSVVVTVFTKWISDIIIHRCFGKG